MLVHFTSINFSNVKALEFGRRNRIKLNDKQKSNDIDQHHQDLMNKTAGSVISKYIFQIKKYKIDSTKPTKEDFYELIKDIASNDKEFQKFTFYTYRIRICYNKEKDSFNLECYS